MAYTLGVDVGQRAEELIDVDLYLQDRHGGLHLVEEARSSIYGFWNEFQHQIQVDLVFLCLQIASSASDRSDEVCSPQRDLHVLRSSNRMP